MVKCIIKQPYVKLEDEQMKRYKTIAECREEKREEKRKIKKKKT